jgi:hypothetical protein
MLGHVRLAPACGVVTACAIVLAANSAAKGAPGAEPGAGESALHVRVRGASRIEAQGVRIDGSAMQLRGSLVDDANMPIAKGPVTITVARAGTPSKSMTLPNGGESCGTVRDARIDADGTAHVTTDDAGRFCLRLPLPIERYAVHVQFPGSAYVDAATIDVPVDLSRRACALAFTPEPRVLSLDGKAALTTIDAMATLESDGATSTGAGLPLTLSTERGPLGYATTDASGHARFAIDPATLGPPGQGELRLSFQGNADASAASRVAAIERHARVTLDAIGAHDGELPPGAPEDGVAIAVHARAAAGEVMGGSVEARVNDVVVGAAPIDAGMAHVVATFAILDSLGSEKEIPITLRYVPSAPWFEPGADSTWRLPIRGRSPLHQAPLVLAGLAIVAWFVASRAQRARVLAKSAPRATTRAVSRGEAKLDIVRMEKDANAGWRGRAIDADDASPIAAARVQIERPAFGRAEILASAVTDDEGRFVLARVVPRAGDELAIEAPLHVTLRRALPPASELDAQLVLRKRALLSRMVAWAKARGRPFDARPDPTPGHVRRAAGDDFRVARWADAIERAAYAGEPVDARVEADVDRLAPSPAVAPAPPSGRAVNEHALANPTKPNR